MQPSGIARSRGIIACADELIPQGQRECNGPAGEVLAEVRRIVGMKPLRSEFAAEEACKAFFECGGIPPAGMDDADFGDPPRTPDDAKEHQPPRHQAALGAVCAGTVHAKSKCSARTLSMVLAQLRSRSQ